MRTTRFAEAEIVWRGRQWLLSLPLSPAALAAVERTASQAGRLNTEWLAEYRILRGELLWVDAEEHPQTCDLELQHLPAGRSFAEALLTEPAERLLAGARRTPIRPARTGLLAQQPPAGQPALERRPVHPPALPRRPFRHLRRRRRSIRSPAAAGARSGRPDAGLGHRSRLRSAAPPDRTPAGPATCSKGSSASRTTRDSGFVDTDNNPVIASHFVWAGDFREGSAPRSRRPAAWGSSTGTETTSSRPNTKSWTTSRPKASPGCAGTRWAEFDYLGQQLTEFGTNRERKRPHPRHIPVDIPVAMRQAPAKGGLAKPLQKGGSGELLSGRKNRTSPLKLGS